MLALTDLRFTVSRLISAALTSKNVFCWSELCICMAVIILPQAEQCTVTHDTHCTKVKCVVQEHIALAWLERDRDGKK